MVRRAEPDGGRPIQYRARRSRGSKAVPGLRRISGLSRSERWNSETKTATTV